MHHKFTDVELFTRQFEKKKEFNPKGSNFDMEYAFSEVELRNLRKAAMSSPVSEDDLEGYLNDALNGTPKDASIVIFCSGEECDLSLHLARNMQFLGYTRVMIFFGVSREWVKFRLEVERRSNCDE